MVFWVLNPLQVQKNGLIIEKKSKANMAASLDSKLLHKIISTDMQFLILP